MYCSLPGGAIAAPGASERRGYEKGDAGTARVPLVPSIADQDVDALLSPAMHRPIPSLEPHRRYVLPDPAPGDLALQCQVVVHRHPGLPGFSSE